MIFIFVGDFFVEEVSGLVFVVFVLDVGVALHIVVHVQYMGKLHSIVNLNSLESKVIKIETPQYNC